MGEVNADLVKRLAELVDGDQWVMADLLVEAFPPDEWGDAKTSVNTGIRSALDEYEHVLYAEHGVDLKASTMRSYRATALAWPGEIRISAASFHAHRAITGEDRQERMERYLKRNGGKALSYRMIRRYRGEEKPAKAPLPWEQQVRRRIESAARKALLEGIVTDRLDWWNTPAVTDMQRTVVINALHALANEMAGGQA